MLAPHNAEGCFPGLGESPVSELRARGVVSEKSRRSLDDSRGMLAQERAGLSTLNENQVVEYDLVENRGKSSAENLKVSLNLVTIRDKQF
jgi:hypothetical protein